MIKLMNIKNIDGLLKVTDESRGDVTMHLPNGTECDLKRDKTAREMLKVLSIHDTQLDISLSNGADLPMFLYYMATECA